jgi:hypothetical protein
MFVDKIRLDVDTAKKRLKDPQWVASLGRLPDQTSVDQEVTALLHSVSPDLNLISANVATRPGQRTRIEWYHEAGGEFGSIVTEVDGAHFLKS